MINKQEDSSPRGLKRVLGVWDLIFYGIVLNQPVGAVGLFGLVSVISRGHIVTTLLLSMVAMSLTAVSYGRMAALYPSSGSAYAYVGRGLNHHLGFMAGWTMVLCYLIIPVINTVFGVLTLQRLFPGLNYAAGVLLFITFISVLNLLGVKSNMTANKVMLFLMILIIGAFIVLAIRYIFHSLGVNGLTDTKPFYNSSSFSISSLASGTSLIALTYVGFDGITTLAEDVRNPRRNILIAIVVVCVFTGLFSALQMYLAQQSAQTMWLDGSQARDVPFYSRIPGKNIETAFMTVCAQVGGTFLFDAMVVAMLIACVGSGMAGQLGAARLLYGMGKDDVIPGKFFCFLDRKRNAPSYNIILIGLISLSGAFLLNYQKIAELINFAALLAFMGVNVAAINRLYFHPAVGKGYFFRDLVIPLLGFLFCLWIWISLPGSSLMLGLAWLLAGVVYLAVTTKGFRKKPVALDF